MTNLPEMAGDDSIRGGKDNDALHGNQGNDQLYGDIGNDTVRGGQGNDLLRGGQNDDQLFGDLGNDTLYGDKGNDRLTGGAGADRFAFRVGDGADMITDYDALDRIRLEGFGAGFNPLVHLQQQGANTVLTLGNGDSITLLGVAAGNLNGSDFEVV
ncbi:MAG: hypothetical protein K0R63_382 [Rickettsiales bacterium]|jgi:Ca2+-binding RTX toxin-like protein|nr:hypothetical protein [Rickettsiales bacterium]